MNRRLLSCVVIAAAIACAPSVQAYLKLGYLLNGQLVSLQWTTMPVRYLVTSRDVNGVTASQLQAATQRAFDEWAQSEYVSLSSQFVGTTNAQPGINDGLNIIGFVPHPELDRTLGATSFEFDSVTGRFIGADIFLNSIFDWSVASGGDTARFDVESIMVHELGHLLGLGHTALGETEPRSGGGRTVLGKRAVMFPIAFGRGSIADRTIEADDIAGIVDIYGNSAAERDLGAIAGRVTLNGSGIFGAHITAFNAATGDLVSGFSLNDEGDFVISSLKPGIYIVRAEPLDDADADSFFDDDAPPNLNFRVTYFTRQVAVPPGGTSGSIEIKVRAK
jgi:hypothetical protein